MKVIIDTGPIVALLNRRDVHHAWSVQESRLLQPPLFSCEAVVTEAFFLLRDIPAGHQRLIDLIGSGRIDLSFSYTANHRRVAELLLKYHDVPISFADACLICMSEQTSSRIMTVDGDFLIYRRHRNEKIDVLMPS